MIIKSFLIFSLSAICHLAFAKQPQFVEFFTNDQFPIKNKHVLPNKLKVYNFDDEKRVQKKYEQWLFKFKGQSGYQALQRAIDGKEPNYQLIKDIEAADQAKIKAQQYQLQRYPAMVFDHGQSVIYGETDLRQALQKYQKYHEKK